MPSKSSLSVRLLVTLCSFAQDATCNNSITQFWGAYSPFFTQGTYAAPPYGCHIDQMNLLQRHGARFPIAGASPSIVSAIGKLQNVQNYTDPRLYFLKDFTYNLGEDVLVPFGAQQSFETGGLAFKRYEALISTINLPFVRASSKARVVDSANNWTAGFAAASFHVYNPTLSVILSESANDTLDDSQCTDAGDSDDETDAWLAVFAPNITPRLNHWAPGANVTDTDTYAILSMRPFHTPLLRTVHHPEFADFEYYMDLSKYYGTGYGAYLSRVQGVGYINELIARLTDTAVNDSTQTNGTLDASPAAFPLNRTLYADFSHDDEMVAVYSAMGLFNISSPLDPTKYAATWVASHLVPFSARMVVERLTGEPLEFCAQKDAPGICEVGAFVESQTYARSGGDGDWQKCYA
ncbi:histidine phosphatase superfamily [Mycena maculata]|uniref:Phytase A n=1 Tax=Mycena maculata TaxID=230809 RepID=A0AAD7N2M5_9AGAR|nr:histidine phosphatase superfamily [Mycena maculata]